ncbi:integrin beta-2-like [Dysidea avara]|uniref:integrin beta-2-like n=1 Tax=Dysidea avara TaxID=196820 RepID=UPI00331C8B0C
MMTGCTLTLLVVMVTLHISGSQDCTIHSSCDACIASGVGCFWCNNHDYRVGQTTELGLPVQFCGTRDQLINNGCPEVNLVGSPSSVPSRVEVNVSSQVTPGGFKLMMRPGDPKSFKINVAPQADFPIDLYILMDLTLTLKDALIAVGDSVNDILRLLNSLTNDAKIGFGSFSDKRAAPFNHVFEKATSYPCAGAGIPEGECDAIYDFRHRLDPTNDTDMITMTFREANITASSDAPEAILDALMQVAVCEERVGWRDSSLARRLVLAITDDEYHYALDGKVAAIVNRHDGGCHLDDDGFYANDTLFDYPSTSQLAEALSTNNIITIFAVDGSQENLYEELVTQLDNAAVGVRQASTTNLLNIISDRYQVLSTTIIPSLSTELQGINISVVPDNCGAHGYPANNTVNICRNVSTPDNVNYTVMVQVHPEACAAYPSGSVSVDVRFVGFGKVTLDIDLLCTCDCTDNTESSSPTCNNHGDLQCSSCQCQSRFYGGDCKCESDGVVPQLNEASVCRTNPSDPVCSGRGTCRCGSCECDEVPDGNGVRYEGSFCQCNPLQCPRNSAGLICSGHGTCACNAACVCDDGYIGLSCSCPTSNQTCIKNDGTNEICSSHGSCRCGVCVCRNYQLRSGSHCDLCIPCSQNCRRTSDIVLRKIRGNCEDDDNDCDRIIMNNNETEVELLSEGSLRECALTSDSCRITYKIDSLKFGTENDLVIFVDNTTGIYRNLRDDSCGSDTAVWPWIVGIVGGIVVVGLITLIVWWVILYLKRYYEYVKFEDGLRRSRKWAPKNPMYLSAKSSYINPQFGRKESLMK